MPGRCGSFSRRAGRRCAPPSTELTERLISALGRLHEQQREIVTLAFFDQLPVSEIARQQGISRAASSMLLLRAVQTLRRSMTSSSDAEKEHGSCI